MQKTFFQLQLNDRAAGMLCPTWDQAADDAVAAHYATRIGPRVIHTIPRAAIRRVEYDSNRPGAKYVTVALVVLALLLPVAHSRADGLAIMGPGGTAIFAPVGGADAKIIQVPPDLSVEAEERFNRWQDYCKPTPVRDRYGVERLRYAHDGCEFGRDQ